MEESEFPLLGKFSKTHFVKGVSTTTYTALMHFDLLLPFCLPQKHFFGEDREGKQYIEMD